MLIEILANVKHCHSTILHCGSMNFILILQHTCSGKGTELHNIQHSPILYKLHGIPCSHNLITVRSFAFISQKSSHACPASCPQFTINVSCIIPALPHEARTHNQIKQQTSGHKRCRSWPSLLHIIFAAK